MKVRGIILILNNYDAIDRWGSMTLLLLVSLNSDILDKIDRWWCRSTLSRT